jgi:hypothetical protein
MNKKEFSGIRDILNQPLKGEDTKTVRIILTNNREYTIKCQNVYVQIDEEGKCDGFFIYSSEGSSYIANIDELIALIQE